MAFAHDTEVSLNATAALVNTGRGGVEELPDGAALDAFVATGSGPAAAPTTRPSSRRCARCGPGSPGSGR